MREATKRPGVKAPAFVAFKATREEVQLIGAIADRAVTLAAAQGVTYTKQEAMMDIDATHSNGCPLDLEKLARCDDFNFAHDVFGIRRHLDRETGKLMNHFLPRCAR